MAASETDTGIHRNRKEGIEMTREKQLSQRLGITKRRVMAGCIAEGIYVLMFLVAEFLFQDTTVTRKLFAAGLILIAITLHLMAVAKNTHEKLETVEILKYYPIDGQKIYQSIKVMIYRFALVHMCLSLIMVCAFGGMEWIWYVIVSVFLTALFTHLGYFIGYGRPIKEDRGREASLNLSCVVCGIFLYPCLCVVIGILEGI